MQKVYKTVSPKRGLVLGLALQGGELAALKQFRTRNKVSYPIAIDSQGKLGKYVEVIPYTVVVDRKGIVRLTHEGFDAATTARLKAQYLKLLAAK